MIDILSGSDSLRLLVVLMILVPLLHYLQTSREAAVESLLVDFGASVCSCSMKQPHFILVARLVVLVHFLFLGHELSIQHKILNSLDFDNVCVGTVCRCM